MHGSEDASGDRYLCGWRVRSDIPLPALIEWPGGPQPPDLRVRIARLAVAGDSDRERPLLRVTTAGVCHVVIPGIATYAVDAAGTEVIIDAAGDPASIDVGVFLLTTVLAVVCHRRGLVPLQASALRIGDRVVALAGRTGAGKSTLAAAMVDRGASLLGDDVAVVDPGFGELMLRPAFPCLRLWRDAMDRLRLSTEGRAQSRAALEKYHLPTDRFSIVPAPLHAVYHLEGVSHPRHGGVRRLHGSEAVVAAAGRVWLRGSLTPLGLAAALLPAAGRVAAVPGGYWLVNSLRTPASLEPTADTLWRLAGG